MRIQGPNSVKAICADGKTRTATYRGNTAFTRVHANGRNYTVTGRIDHNLGDQEYYFYATAGLNQDVIEVDWK